jgi:hypothetical protein
LNITLASGSSSSAAAAAAYRLGLVDRKVKVRMPGGTLDIALGEDWSVELTGTVNAVATGNFAPDQWAKLNKKIAGICGLIEKFAGRPGEMSEFIFKLANYKEAT